MNMRTMLAAVAAIALFSANEVKAQSPDWDFVPGSPDMITNALDWKFEVQVLDGLNNISVTNCVGYPAGEQRLHNKPARFATPFLVHENKYQPADEPTLTAMHNERRPEDGFPKAVQAICRRKWSSPFMEEMNRSVLAWLKRWMHASVGGEG